MRLSRLLRPRTLAVVGGGAWGRSVVEQARKLGFAGPIWPVHPTADAVGGEAAFRRVADLPEAPDAAWIGVNRGLSVEIVGALAAMGAGGVTCFASGFAEAGAEDAGAGDLQAALVRAAGDMPMIGPNCYGFINGLDRVCLWPDQHGVLPVARGVAVLTQSSNIAINLTMQARGLPLGYVITCGNQAQTAMPEAAQAVLGDKRVTALGLHIEGVSDLRAIEILAEAAERAGKPVIALKMGRSEAARAATVSHTASLAGSDAGGRALMRRLGFGLVSDPASFLEALKLAHHTGGLTSARLVTASSSGGEASLVADLAAETEVHLPPLGSDQRVRLRTALGPLVALANPLDYHTYIWGDVDRMAATFAALPRSGPGPDTALATVICDFPRPDRCDGAAWDCVIPAAARAQAETGVPFAILSSIPEGLPEPRIAEIEAAGLIPLCGMREALEAVQAVVRRARGAPVLLPGAGGDTVLGEATAKADLARFGLPVPRGGQADTPEAAAELAAALGGTVVLKGEGVAHKSEAGLVRVGLPPDAVAAAAREMRAQGYLVEEVVGGAVAELLIGVTRDPAHGFVLTLGAGGVLTEVLDDSRSLLLPVTAQDIRAALAELRIAPVLQGYRGRPGADMAAIVAAVLTVQDYVSAEVDHVEEVEINPLICQRNGAVAVDALIRRGGME